MEYQRKTAKQRPTEWTKNPFSISHCEPSFIHVVLSSYALCVWHTRGYFISFKMRNIWRYGCRLADGGAKQKKIIKKFALFHITCILPLFCYS